MSVELDILAEFLEAYGRAGDVSVALESALPKLTNHVGCDAASFFSADLSSSQLVCQACVGPVDIRGLRVPFGSGIIGRVYETQKIDIVEHAGSDKDHRKSVDQETGFVTKNVLTLPVTFKDSRIGALQLLNRSRAENDDAVFPDEFIGVARALASGLGLGYHSAEITEQVRANDALLRDVELAGTVQEALTPAVPERLGIAAGILPFKQLSGDFYDFLEVEDRIYIIQGDVSGKGVAASLTMAQAQVLFRTFARARRTCEEIAMLMNSELHRDLGVARFVTVFIVCIDRGSREVSYVNAGHGDVLCVHEDKSECFSSTSPPLGIVSSEVFKPSQGVIPFGDWRLWIVTDGISEAELNGSEIGMDGMRAIAGRYKDLSLQDAVNSTLDLIRSQKLVTSDDATLVLVDTRLVR